MTLTDDQIASGLNTLALQPRMDTQQWEREIARHFYALGLAAIPREPTTRMLAATAVVPDYMKIAIWQSMYDAAQGGKHEPV